MIAVNLVGYKKSGKTTLAVQLAEELERRGVKAAAVKSSHHRLDKEGTDTDQLCQAYGAAGAVTEGEAGGEAALFWRGKRHLPDLLPLLDAEVVVVEGGKELGWLPRILLLKNPAEAETLEPGLALATYGTVCVPGLPALETPVQVADLILEKGFALPGLDCGACGRTNCLGLARDIAAGEAQIAECLSLESSVTVEVNGVPLGLSPFVERFFASTLKGMLAELKGYAPGRVNIRMKG